MAGFPELVARAVEHARAKHPRRYASAHEAYGILKEEFEEFWDEVKKQANDPVAMLKELSHVAAVAQRAAEDLNLLQDFSLMRLPISDVDGGGEGWFRIVEEYGNPQPGRWGIQDGIAFKFRDFAFSDPGVRILEQTELPF